MIPEPANLREKFDEVKSEFGPPKSYQSKVFTTSIDLYIARKSQCSEAPTSSKTMPRPNPYNQKYLTKSKCLFVNLLNKCNRSACIGLYPNGDHSCAE